MNFMFSWQGQHFTRSLRSLVIYCSCHSNIKIHIFSPPCNILYICVDSRSVYNAKILDAGLIKIGNFYDENGEIKSGNEPWRSSLSPVDNFPGPDPENSERGDRIRFPVLCVSYHREPSHPFGIWIKDQISRYFEFLIHARGLLVRGLEPRLRKSLVACSEI